MRFLKRFLRATATAGLVTLSLSAAAGGGYNVQTTDTAFEDVLDGLKLAIQERGMYINNIMHMDEMLERTGKDLGADGALFGQAHSVEFCSAVLSREMIAEEPSWVVNCPFIIAVYTLPSEPGTTYVAYREIPQDQVEQSPAMAKVAEMLRAVATAAVDW